MARAQTQYKDRLFSFIFGSDEHKDWTLSLYNAVNGSSYDDPESIVITTIRDALYLGMHNDVSFIISNEMNMFEQQSTFNPNSHPHPGQWPRDDCQRGGCDPRYAGRGERWHHPGEGHGLHRQL